MATKKRNRRDSYLQRVYGITLQQYKTILARQSGTCAICGKRPKPASNLHVDHDHKSGIVRGLLCWYCNRRLVGRHHDGRLLRAAADYLDNKSWGHSEWIVPKKKRKRRKK